MGAAEVEGFLTHLAVAKRVSASTQNQVKSAVLFLYKDVLGESLPWLESIESAFAPIPTTYPSVRTMIRTSSAGPGLRPRIGDRSRHRCRWFFKRHGASA